MLPLSTAIFQRYGDALRAIAAWVENAQGTDLIQPFRIICTCGLDILPFFA
jgi:hypothetical protein